MKNIHKLTLSALFLALGIILPFFTGQIPQIGNMMLPMHIPVLLCGFVCGGPWGLAVGFITPLLRSLLFGRPLLMPAAVGMAFELATYGLVSGLLYAKLSGHRFRIYLSLLLSMLSGRLVWGLVSIFLYRLLGNFFTWELFAAGAFFNAVPGILVQLVLIPAILYTLRKTNLMR